MNIKEKKLNLIKKMYIENEKLLDICNEIEINLNYVQINFDYTKYNLNNIHGVIENTFNFSFVHNYNNLMNNYKEMTIKDFNISFSFVYKQLNFMKNYYEQIIKLYGKFVKNDNKLLNKINDLLLNNEIDNNLIKDFFSNYTFLIFNF